MNNKQKALLFDMNGTMIDDMEYHCRVWHELLNKDLTAGMTYEEVKVQMYGKNSELLQRIFGTERFTAEELDFWSIEKEKRYQAEYLPHLKLLDGLEKFFEKAYSRSIPMALCSAAITFNVDFVLDNLEIRHYFQSIISADNVRISKPNPETFLKAAKELEVTPLNCIVFEDAPKGVEAARNAGMDCVVLLTAHEEKEFKSYNNIICMVKDYSDPILNKLIKFD